MSPDPAPGADRAPGLDRRHEHVHTVALVALTAATVVSVAVERGAGRLATLGLGVALVALEAVLGRRATDEASPLVVAAVHLAAALVLWIAAVLVTPLWLWVVFLLYWWAWSLRPPPLGLVPPAVVSVALAVLNHHWGVGWAAAVVSGVVSFAFGLLLRASVSGVVARAEAQARLIAELEATRAELAAASRAAGAAGERERLAREIHDTLAQAFTSVVMLLQAADAAIGSDDVAARRHVASAERTARDGLAEARALVAAGQPDDVTADALPAAIGRVAERVAAETGLRIEVAVEGEPAPLRPTAEVALLRTVQEALANVRKHAQASAVVVRLAYGADAAAVEVRDDGVGFATASPPAPSPSGGGFGLRGLRARLEELQGTVAVESAPGAGTTVRAVVAR